MLYVFRNPLCMDILLYRKKSNNFVASFKHQHLISAKGKLQKLNTASLKHSVQGGGFSKNVALFENVGWLFKSYLVLFKSFLFCFKKLNAKVTYLLHKPACKR